MSGCRKLLQQDICSNFLKQRPSNGNSSLRLLALASPPSIAIALLLQKLSYGFAQGMRPTGDGWVAWAHRKEIGRDERRRGGRKRKGFQQDTSGMGSMIVGVRIRTSWSRKDTRPKREEADGVMKHQSVERYLFPCNVPPLIHNKYQFWINLGSKLQHLFWIRR